MEAFYQRRFSAFECVFFLGFLIFTWIFLFFSELRTKAIKIQIEGEKIIVSNFLGLGATRHYHFYEFDGFQTAYLPGKFDTYEYLYLMKRGKKVIKLSQFYHSNYSDLKIALSDKVRNLGLKRFNLIQEFKEIFI